jgi:hypothetical protein
MPSFPDRLFSGLDRTLRELDGTGPPSWTRCECGRRPYNECGKRRLAGFRVRPCERDLVRSEEEKALVAAATLGSLEASQELRAREVSRTRRTETAKVVLMLVWIGAAISAIVYLYPGAR